MNAPKFSIEIRHHGMTVEAAVITETGAKTVAGQVQIACAETMKMRVLSDFDEITPLVSLPRDLADQFLQSMMNELWKLGIRPADIGTPGHLAATQKHLDDMRAIVAKQLGIKL